MKVVVKKKTAETAIPVVIGTEFIKLESAMKLANIIPSGGTAIVVMEGVSMYLTPEELNALLENLKGHFGELHLLMDCYSTFAAKASKFKNPINEVGVYRVYGLDDPESISCLSFRKEWDMTPEALIAQLPQGDRRLFRKLYAGGFARKLYRLYEYEGRGRL